MVEGSNFSRASQPLHFHVVVVIGRCLPDAVGEHKLHLEPCSVCATVDVEFAVGTR